MTAEPGPPGPTDAELVARVLAADREAFAAVYDRYGDRLYDFAYSMLRHREDAADAVADSFVLFAERLRQLRDPDRLRPWLYAIVRSECLRRLKARKRVAFGDEEQLVEMADDAMTPEESAERAALQQLVWDASAGLADRDRALLDLHLRQGLEGAELGEAIGVTANNAYVMLNRLRAQVDRSLGALLIARLGRDDCDDLDALLADWDGGFSPLVRKRVARHVDQCDVCGERRRRMVSPWMLLAGVPMVAAPAALRDRVLEDTRLVAYAGDGGAGSAGTVGGHRWGASRVSLVAAALLAVAIVATTLLWPGNGDTSPAQAEATGSASETPAGTAPPLSPAPTTAAPSTPSGTESPSQSPSESVTAAPGALTVSSGNVDLGRRSSRAAVDVRNTGGLPVSFTVDSRQRWLSASPASADLAGGATTRLAIRVDRSAIPEGRSTGRVVLTWAGGTATVEVTLEEERDPAVGAPQAAGASCQVPVTVRITDDSRVSSARLRWSGPAGSGSATLRLSGSTWTATLPVTIGGTYALTATATDSRGNTGTGPTTRVDLNPCPQ